MAETRDVKGLYAKAETGKVKQFTGMDSSFEAPQPRSLADLILNTNIQTESESLKQLLQAVRPRVLSEKQ